MSTDQVVAGTALRRERFKNVLLLALALGISTASWPSARRGAHALTRPEAGPGPGPGPGPDRTVRAGVVSDDKFSGTVRR
ncbi:hypothetical protein WEH80_37095 [Actinomycetes bacterium KLBMP 9759]